MADIARFSLLLLLAAMPATEGASIASGMSSWMHGLVIPIPPGSHFALPVVGDLLIESGECRGLQIESAEAIDNSTGLDLELGIRLNGAAVSCSLVGSQNGSLVINISLVNSSVALAVRMNPWIPVDTPNLPLPLGPLEMTLCSLDMHIAETSFSGTAAVAALVNGLPYETLKSLMGSFIQEPVCNVVRNMVNVNGTAAFLQGQGILAPLLLPPPALPQPRILAPTENLSTYPAVAVVKELINTQFPKWAGRYLQVLKVPIFMQLFGNENVSLSMQTFSIVGRGPKLQPGIAITTNQSHVAMSARLADLQFQGTLGISATLPDQPEFRNNITFVFGLDDMDLGLNAFFNKQELRRTGEDDAGGLLSCYIDSARSATDPGNQSLAVTDLAVGLQRGTEIRLEDGDALEESARVAVNAVITALQKGYLGSISRLINGGLGQARGVVNEALWQWLDAKPPCDTTVTADGVKQIGLTAIWICSVVAAGLALAAACLAHCVRKARERLATQKTLSDTSSETSESEASSASPGAAGVAAGAAREVSEIRSVETTASEGGSLGGRDVCLALEPSVPAWLTVSYPLLLLSCTFLFLYADLALGAVVNVNLSAYGDRATFGPVFAFSMINTVKDSWDAGAYFIAVLTFVMSALWPFAKLLLLFVAWLTPGRLLRQETRGRMLEFLDLAGKYSFMDTMFLVLTVSAFSLEWSHGGTDLKVQVEPTAAFYCFVVATAGSLVLGHVASEYHRYGLREERRSLDESAKRYHGMASGQSLMSWEGAAPLSKFAPHRTRRLVTGVLLGTLLLASLACFMHSFEFVMGGLASEVLEVPDKLYSLISVGTALPESGTGGALVFLEVLFLLLTVVMPLLLLCLLIALWLVPLPPRAQDLLLYAAHILDCWASMDVAALTLTVEALELNHLAEFLVRSTAMAKPCGMVKDLTQEECFAVNIDLHAGFVMLLLAGIAMVVVPKVTHRACAAAIEARNGRALERMQRSEQQQGSAADPCGSAEPRV